MNVEVKVAPKGSPVQLAQAKTVNGVVAMKPGEQVALDVSSRDVASYAREGSDLLVELKNGEVVRLVDFYGPAPTPSELFLVDDGKLVSAELTAASNGVVAATYVPEGIAAEFASLGIPAAGAAAAAGGGGLSTAAIIGGIALAGGGIAAAAGGGGGSSSGQSQQPPTLADTTPPTPATGLVINGTGTQVTGTAEAGATVLIDVNGDGVADATGTVGGNGSFAVNLPSPLTNGQTVSVLVRDAAGNTSGPATVIAPDTTPPVAATGLALSADGAIITGRAEAGATVRIDTNGDGVPDATGVARPDGTFSINLPQPLTDGQIVTVTVRDPAGNTSGPATATAPDTTAPPPATGVIISPDGTTVSGTAQPGTLVGVDVNRDGVIDGGATTGADGRFTIPLSPPLTNGETVTVTVRDNAGNTSAPTPVTAPDTTAPAPASGLAISADGTTLTGTAEAGASVKIDVNGDGVADKTVTAGADGTFTAALSPALLDGQTVTVIVADAAGNASGPATVVAPDTIQVPLAPTIDPSNGQTVNGAAQVGYVVTLTNGNGVVIGSVVTGADGRWTFTPSSALVDGTIVNAVATNAQGVQGPAASIIVDAVAPTAPTIEPSNGLVLAGTAEAGSVVTLTRADGTVIGTTTTAADGRWTFTPSGPLGDGIVVSATASDAAGNVSPAVTTTTDAVSPSAPVVTPSNGTVLTGSAEAGSTVTILNANGVPIATTVAAANGTWSIALSPSLANGVVVSATATDAVGNVSPATVATIDAAPPASPVLAATNGAIVSGVAEANAVVTLTTANGIAIGQVTAGADGRFSLTLGTPLADGAVVVARATDAAGNTGNPAAVTVDAVAPGAPVIAPSNGTIVSGTAEAGSVVTVRAADGTVIGTTTTGANGTWSVTPATSLPNGVVATASATDAAGNVGAPTSVTIDSVAPASPILALSNGVVLTGSAEAGSTVTISSGGATIGQVVADANGNWSFTPSTPLANMAVVSAIATDAAGNASTPGSTTIDTTLPATPVIAPTNGVVVTGVADAGVTVTVTTGTGGAIGQVMADANGNWSITPGTPLADGTVVRAVATNGVGSSSAPGSGIVDAVAPAAPVIAPSDGAEIRGTAEVGAVVTVTGPGGVQIGQATAGANGAWSVVPSTPLGDGTLVTATARDAAGNGSAPATATIDAIAPAAPTILPTAGVVISGTAEAGATVTLTNGGTVIGTTVAGANGQWSFTPATQLANGVVVAATASDAAGNTGPAASTIVDGTAPGSPVIAPTNGTVITGSTEAGATVTLRDAGGTVIGQTTADANGNWTFTPLSPLANGAVVQAVSSDAAGNNSSPAAVAVDAVAPLVTIAASAGVTFAGTAEAGSLVTVSQGGVAIGQTTADANGRWTLTAQTPIANGVQVAATATDAAGNVSAPANTIVDAIAPAAPVVAPSNGTLVTGTAEAGSTVTLTDAGGTVIGTVSVSAGGSWSFTPSTPLANGATVSVSAADAAGNVGPAASVTVDAVAPAAPAITPSNGTTVSGTAEANAVVTLTDGNGTAIGTTTVGGNGTWSFTPATPLSNGTVVIVRAADAAGNVSPTASTTVDSVAPAAPVISPSNGAVVSGTGEIGATIVLTENNGSVIGTTTVNQSGNWSYTPAAPLADGTVVNAIARDAAGNDSPTATTTVDSMPPIGPVIDPTNGIFIHGTAEIGATILLTNALGNPLGSAVVDANGRWTATFATPLANGTVVVATAVDAVGNAGAPISVVVDALAPLAPVIAPSNGTVIFGTAEAGSTVTLTAGNGAAIGTVVANAQGGFTFTPGTPLTNGTVVNGTATDLAGNVSLSSTVTVDAVAPPPPVIDPTNGITISGSAEAGATITLTGVGGVAIATVQASAGGTWSFTPSTPLANGVVVMATATDTTGNVSTPAAATIDAIAPGLPTILPTNGLSLSGTAEAGATVTAVDGNNNPIGTATVAQNGTWTITPGSQLADATQIRVVATDAAGNVSAPASAVVDGIAPTAPVLALSNGLVLTGTAEAGSLVSVSIGGSSIGQVRADAGGNWVLTPATQIGNAVVVSATATDAAGNVSLAGSTVIDGLLPSTPIIAPTNGLSITGTSDAGVSVTVSISGGSSLGTVTADNTGHWTVTPLVPLPDGTVLIAIATNQVLTPSAPGIGIVDGIAPAVPSIVPSNGVVLTGVAEAGAVVTLTGTGGVPIGTATANASGNWSFTPTLPIGNGIVVSATATDAAGNVSLSASTTVDAIAPAAPVIAPTNGVLLMGTAEAGATVTLLNGQGVTIGTTITNGSGNWTFTPATALANATVVTATATDAVGNVGPVATAVVDSVAPAIPTALVVATNGATITGLAEANSQVRVVVGTDTAHPVIVTANGLGIFTATFQTPVVDGQSVTVTATDAAGNTSQPGNAIAPDLGVPLLTIAEAADGYINGTEIGNGIQVRVGLTPGSDPGDTVSVRFAGTNGYIGTTTHILTAAEKLAGFIDLTLSPPQGMGPFPQGSAQVSASIAGGLSSLPATFLVDTVAPATPVLSLATNLLSISSEPGASLLVTVNAAGTTGTVTLVADNNGLASLDLLSGANLGLSLGDLLNASVSVRGTDLAGNQSNVATLGLNNALLDPVVSVGNFDVNAALLPPTLGFSGNTEAGGSVRVEVVTPAATVTVNPGVDANGHFAVNLLDPTVLSQLNLSVTQLLALGSGLGFNVVSTDAQGHDSARYGLSLTGSGLSLDIGQITVSGTAGNDVLTGSNGSSEVINAGGGSDLILNVGTNDRIDAGAGDDTIQITAANHTSINGGSGFDTILFTNGIDIDYNSPGTGTWTNIERIDLGRGDSGSALTLTSSEVNAITESNHTLQITGEANDTLNVTGAVATGQATVSGHLYDVYTFGTATLYVEHNTVTVVH